MVRLAFLLGLAAAAVALHPLLRTNIDVVDLIESEHGAEATQAVASEEWFTTQKVDHTDAANTNVWSQRFFTNDVFYGGPGSPVFVYINGENVARNTTVVSMGLFMNVLAKKHKALIVSLEHRYYGKSQPMRDLSTASLKFLSSEQALSDLVSFQDHLTAKRNLTKDSKWVAFGGSYPGMLAAWAKLKHGSRFAGSVASSGPILAKGDYHEYGDVVEFGLRYFGGDACVNTVKAGLEGLHALLASSKPEDVAQLQALFKPCSPLKDDFDRMTVESAVFGNFQITAQTNDYTSFNLNATCALFAQPRKTPLEKLAEHNARFMPTCTDSDYQNAWIKPLTNTTLSTTSVARQWMYQTCAEFGFGQTTASATSIFSALSYNNVDKVLYEMCYQVYGIPKAQTDAAIAAVNQKYGGLDIDVDHVVFPNGNIDPWSALSVTNATGVVNPKSEVVFIDGTSHCRDMSAASPTDSASVVLAHQRVERAVDGFLHNKC
ncbi:hypothetical protein H310_10484 [Aphanomyces invadans]|uniref:Serine protease n=1 Tax=Aphanomyces invadans TaxID=157072 RepID=A0A024TSL1_9STRA|nr:hypothetical protein H310_10484 [Aphanomyces invadans]ETV96322.1 hypothetical protein H310_10484 [Aphanomyces invadans]|eukprot:XP_008875114.1 hypothetical protein H310_10484 [Aphanomyces invadans]